MRARICACGQRVIATQTPYAMCVNCATEFWRAAAAHGSQRAKLQRIIDLRPPVTLAEQESMAAELTHWRRDNEMRDWIDTMPPKIILRQSVREAVEGGMTRRAAAVFFGVNRETVNRYIGHKSSRYISDEMRARVIELRGKSWSVRRVAKELGIGTYAVAKISRQVQEPPL